MAWLVSDARVLASAEVATSRAERRRGLLGRDSIEGALVIEPCRWIHTIGMRFPLDVAYLDERGVVVKTIHMARFRLGVPVWHARCVIEAEAGKFSRWGLRVGDQIEIRVKDDEATHHPGSSADSPNATPHPATPHPNPHSANTPTCAPTAGSPTRHPPEGGA